MSFLLKNGVINGNRRRIYLTFSAVEDKTTVACYLH